MPSLEEMYVKIFGKPAVCTTTGRHIGDVTILMTLSRKHPLYFHSNEKYTSKDRFQVACPREAKVRELKKRINGKIDIPWQNIRLSYCGEVLRDEEPVPNYVFEKPDKVAEDADVFRPRLVLTIREAMELPPEDDAAPVAEASGGGFGLCGGGGADAGSSRPKTPMFDPFGTKEKQRLAAEAALKARLEAEEREKEEAEAQAKAMQEEKEQFANERKKLADELNRKADEAAKKALLNSNFHLREELEKIHCEVFYDAFVTLGFDDEGSFSILTEDVLRDQVYVPRAARLRILALIDAVRRRVEVIAHQKGITAEQHVEKAFLQNKSIETMALDFGEMGGGGENAQELDAIGGEENEEDDAVEEKAAGFFTKKADLKKAWEKKKKLMEKRKKMMEGVDPDAVKEVPKKTHAPEIMQKIESIRRRCTADEYGVPKDADFLLEEYRRVSINPRVIKQKQDEEEAVRIVFAMNQGLEAPGHASHNKKTAAQQMIKEFNAKKAQKNNKLSFLQSGLSSSPAAGASAEAIATQSSYALIRKASMHSATLHGNPSKTSDVGDTGGHDVGSVKTKLSFHSESCGSLSVAPCGATVAGGGVGPADADVDAELLAATKWSYENNKPFCCDKHQNEVFKRQEQFLQSRRAAHISDLQIQMWNADVYKNGYISREMLRVIGLELLKKLRHLAVEEEVNSSVYSEANGGSGVIPVPPPPPPNQITGKGAAKAGSSPSKASSPSKKDATSAATGYGASTPPTKKAFDDAVEPTPSPTKNVSTSETLLDDVEKILDRCIMSTHNQVKYADWSGLRERQQKLCNTIPFQQYDTQLYIYLLADWIADLDIKRLIA